MTPRKITILAVGVVTALLLLVAALADHHKGGEVVAWMLLPLGVLIAAATALMARRDALHPVLALLGNIGLGGIIYLVGVLALSWLSDADHLPPTFAIFPLVLLILQRLALHRQEGAALCGGAGALVLGALVVLGSGTLLAAQALPASSAALLVAAAGTALLSVLATTSPRSVADALGAALGRWSVASTAAPGPRLKRVRLSREIALCLVERRVLRAGQALALSPGVITLRSLPEGPTWSLELPTDPPTVLTFPCSPHALPTLARGLILIAEAHGCELRAPWGTSSPARSANLQAVLAPIRDLAWPAASPRPPALVVDEPRRRAVYHLPPGLDAAPEALAALDRLAFAAAAGVVTAPLALALAALRRRLTRPRRLEVSADGLAIDGQIIPFGQLRLLSLLPVHPGPPLLVAERFATALHGVEDYTRRVDLGHHILTRIAAFQGDDQAQREALRPLAEPPVRPPTPAPWRRSRLVTAAALGLSGVGGAGLVYFWAVGWRFAALHPELPWALAALRSLTSYALELSGYPFLAFFLIIVAFASLVLDAPSAREALARAPLALHVVTALLLAGALAQPLAALVELPGAVIVDYRLDGRRWDGLDLEGARVRGAPFSGEALTSLRGVRLRGADLGGVRFERVDLSGADLSGADLQGARFVEAELSGADLTGAHAPWLNLDRVDLRGARLRGADLTAASAWAAEDGAPLRLRLDGADLSGARLEAAVLEGVSLRGADLEGADLHLARLQSGDLRGVRLRGVALRDATLHNVDLSDADLTGADLSKALLLGVEVEGVVWEGARCPDGRLSEAHGGVCPGILPPLSRKSIPTQEQDHEPE